MNRNQHSFPGNGSKNRRANPDNLKAPKARPHTSPARRAGSTEQMKPEKAESPLYLCRHSAILPHAVAPGARACRGGVSSCFSIRSEGSAGFPSREGLTLDKMQAIAKIAQRFSEGEASLRLEGLRPSVFGLSLKERVLSGEITLEQAERELSAHYTPHLAQSRD